MTGVTDMIGPDNIYPTDERVGATLKRRLRRCAKVDTRPACLGAQPAVSSVAALEPFTMGGNNRRDMAIYRHCCASKLEFLTVPFPSHVY